MKMARIAEMQSAPQVTSCAPRSVIQRPNSPAMTAAASGRKTAKVTSTALSALHEVDVFDGDRAAIAEVDDEDREADGRLGRRHGQHEHGEDLPHHVVEEGREGDEV